MKPLEPKVGNLTSPSNSPSRLRFFAFLIFLTLTSAARGAVPTMESIGFTFLEQGVSSPEGIEVQVVDELTERPILDAQIEVKVLASSATKVVHVRRAGYSGVSIYGVRGGVLKVMLKPDSALGTAAVSSGELRGYLPLLSGNVDGGIILRTLGVSDLLALNVDSLLSPLKDEIRALGRRMIPSNIVFPKQNVSLIIKLDKPSFRLPMSTGRFTGLVGAQAAIKVGDLMALPSNPDPVDFANLLQLRKIGWTERLNPTGDFVQDISLTNVLAQDVMVKVSNVPAQSNVFALSLVDMNDDRQFMTVADVKGVRHGTFESSAFVSMNLTSPQTMPSGAVLYVIGAAVSADGKQISASLQDATQKKVEVKSLLSAPRIGAMPKDGMDVETLSVNSISALTLQEKLDSKGARSHRVFVLPEAGKTHVDFQTVFPGVTLDQVGLSQMEFTSVDPRSVDGVGLAKMLKRFTYSISE